MKSLNSATETSWQHYISLRGVEVPHIYIQRLTSAILQQDNARLHVAPNAQEFFFTQQIELLPRPACCPDPSSIENVWSSLAQRLARDTPHAATVDQTLVVCESRMECYTSRIHPKPLCFFAEALTAVILNNDGYTNY
ncbi:hypothetical protein TNCV_5121001 [Trichonephila clavipes]|nr:hypothetical protein TNCV_5121001 [Trichonephila clavipes]